MEVQAVPLASQALCSPYTYEPSYEGMDSLSEVVVPKKSWVSTTN